MVSLLVKMCLPAILFYVLSYGCDLKVILLNSLASMLRDYVFEGAGSRVQASTARGSWV